MTKKRELSRKMIFGLTVFGTIVGVYVKRSFVKPPKDLPQIRVCYPTQEKTIQYLTIPSTLSADEITLKPRSKGRLMAIHCKEGDIVTKDQLLFKMDDALLGTQKKQQEAYLKKAQAQLENAQKQLDRSSELLKKGAHTQEQWDTYHMNVEAIKSDMALYQAKIEEIDLNIKDTNITAPFSGRIGFIHVQEGDYLQDTTVVFTSLHKICTLESLLAIPEKYYQKLIKLDDKNIQIQILNPDNSPLGDAEKSIIMDQKIDITTGTIALKVFVNNPDMTLKSGMSILAKFNLGPYHSAFTLPAKAIIQSSKGNSAYKYDPTTKKVQIVPLEVEEIVQEKALIKTEIDAKDSFVLEGHVNLTDGARVKVIQ